MNIYLFGFRNNQPDAPVVVPESYELDFTSMFNNAISFDVTNGKLISIKVRAEDEEAASRAMMVIRANHLTRHGISF